MAPVILQIKPLSMRSHASQKEFIELLTKFGGSCTLMGWKYDPELEGVAQEDPVKPNEETECYEKSGNKWKVEQGDPDEYVSWNHGVAYVEMEDSEKANAAKRKLEGIGWEGSIIYLREVTAAQVPTLINDD